MTANRMPLYLSLASLTLATAAVLILQPYSVTSPWSGFNRPGQRYFSAALRRDSVELRRLSLSRAPIEWALSTEHNQRSSLAAWAHHASASVGFTRGDTTAVLFDTPTRACPVLLTFVGPDARARVLQAAARCFTRRGWPEDQSVIAVPR
jgi:hypothetical protein